jgi:DNA-binding NarL/FixJ family response regulator
VGKLNGSASALIVARPGPWRDALEAMLVETPQIEAIHLADDAVTALRAAAALNPDLLLLDTDLPGDQTWNLTRQLKAVCPSARSLVLVDDLQDLGCKDGTADIVVVKGCPAAVLFEALESLLPESDRDSANADSGNRSRR